MTEFFTNLADFIGAKWAELLGIVGGSAGIIAILTFLVRTITPLIVAKINKKNNLPKGLDNVKGLVEEVKVKLNELDNFTKELPTLIQQYVNQGIALYQEQKKIAYQKIIEGKQELDKEVEKVVEETKQELDKVETQVKDIEIKENKAQNQEQTQELNNEPTKETKAQNNTEKKESTKKVVIVNE